MTMVVSAMTDDHVFFASDRRTTYSETREIANPAENKAVILNSEFVLTYTGLSDLDGIPTDAWVTDLLAKEPVENWLLALLNRTGPAVRRVRARPDVKRHAFLLTGYAKMPSGRRPYRPVGFIISNCHRPDGTTMRLPELAFSLSILRLGNTKVRIDTVGRELLLGRRMALEKEIRRQLRATPHKPQRVLDILCAEIRQVASRDKGVGSDLMAVSFPMAAVHSPLNGVIIPHKENWQEQLIAYYSAPDSPIVSYGPSLVQPGFQLLGPSVSNDPQNHPAVPHRLMGNRTPYR